MPKRTASQEIGARGEAFAVAIISEMGFVWNPVHEDNAVDGTIEIVDRSGSVTGNRLLVQIKATNTGFGGDSDGFSRGFTADHIDYWLRCTLPVIVICVDLRLKVAWWKDARPWFSNRTNHRRRSMTFDSTADQFTVASANKLAALATPQDQPLPRLSGEETLVSNLLLVTAFAPQINTAPTSCIDRGHAWDLMRAADHGFESGFLLHSGRIYSFSPLDVAPLDSLVAGPVETIPTNEWADSSDPDTRRTLVWLLNSTIRAMHHHRLAFHLKKNVVFYRRTDDKSPARVRGRGPRDRGRTWFTPVLQRDDLNKVNHYRHTAANLSFRPWDGCWYLEINPTWHFTYDGENDSAWDAEKVSILKRMEGQRAVRDHVRAWADYLRRPTEDTLFAKGDRRIEFGELLKVKSDLAIDDKVWKRPPQSPVGPLLTLASD